MLLALFLLVKAVSRPSLMTVLNVSEIVIYMLLFLSLFFLCFLALASSFLLFSWKNET